MKSGCIFVCKARGCKFLSSVVLLTISLIMLLSISSVNAQNPQGIDLMQPVKLNALRLTLSPPSFWNPYDGENLNFASYTGPGAGGIFPVVKIFFTNGENDLLTSKAKLSGSVRLALLEYKMKDIRLIDEVSTNLGGREILEQLFSCSKGSREVNAIAYHFNAGGRQYSFLYFHSATVFDQFLPLARGVFSSIAVEGEDAGFFEIYFPWFAVFLCIVGGVYYWLKSSRKKAVRQAGVATLAVVQREDAIASGPKGIDFDEYDDDDVHSGAGINVVTIDND